MRPALLCKDHEPVDASRLAQHWKTPVRRGFLFVRDLLVYALAQALLNEASLTKIGPQ